MIDNVVEDLRKAFANYKKYAETDMISVKKVAEVQLQVALTTFFDAYGKECL